MGESCEIKMKIKSRRYDVEETLFSALVDEFDGFDDLYVGDDALAEFEQGETIELGTEGVLNIDENKVEIVYQESELTGMEGSETVVFFSKDDPGFVSMTRSGTVSTALVFERGKRHHCVYNTPIMPFEICVHTLKVQNSILSCGKLELDYIIEIRGAKAERTKFEIILMKDGTKEKDEAFA